jgi:hypothetical protein
MGFRVARTSGPPAKEGPEDHTASDSDENVKSRIFIGGIIITNDDSSPHAHRLADLLDVVEHDRGRFVEAEVLDRVLDLAVLDVERAVARQAGEQHGLRIDQADVPGARDEHALLGAPDQIHRRLVAAGHDEVAGLADRLLPCFCAQ